MCITVGVNTLELLVNEGYYSYPRLLLTSEKPQGTIYIEDGGNLGEMFHRRVIEPIHWSAVLRNGKHGELNYHLKQFFAGRDGFTKHSHPFKLDESSNCVECAAWFKVREHVMFHCPRFIEKIRKVEQHTQCRHRLQPLKEMLKSEVNWIAINAAIATIQKELQEFERTTSRRRTSRWSRRNIGERMNPTYCCNLAKQGVFKISSIHSIHC